MPKFTAARNAHRNDPEPFQLEYENATGEIVEEAFVAYPGRVPGALKMDIVKVGAIDSEPMWQFFRAALSVPGDEAKSLTEYSRFRAIVDNPDFSIDAMTLVNIINWIQTDRPTSPSSP